MYAARVRGAHGDANGVRANGRAVYAWADPAGVTPADVPPPPPVQPPSPPQPPQPPQCAVVRRSAGRNRQHTGVPCAWADCREFCEYDRCNYCVTCCPYDPRKEGVLERGVICKPHFDKELRCKEKSRWCSDLAPQTCPHTLCNAHCLALHPDCPRHSADGDMNPGPRRSTNRTRGKSSQQKRLNGRRPGMSERLSGE